ncbi:hypothetical protein B0H14DRAFT_2570311 [Mycena olivaceomarginata]|nr:hypothetical protein B0H14DRAFT_2570311 [Mycena olivaceomarginata]
MWSSEQGHVVVRKLGDAVRLRVAPGADVDTIDGEVAATGDGEEDVDLGYCEAALVDGVPTKVTMMGPCVSVAVPSKGFRPGGQLFGPHCVMGVSVYTTAGDASSIVTREVCELGGGGNAQPDDGTEQKGNTAEHVPWWDYTRRDSADVKIFCVLVLFCGWFRADGLRWDRELLNHKARARRYREDQSARYYFDIEVRDKHWGGFYKQCGGPAASMPVESQIRWHAALVYRREPSQSIVSK